MSKFEVRHRRWRSPRSPMRRSTSPWSRSASADAGTPPTSSTRRSRSSPRSGWTTPTISATPSPRSPGRRPESSPSRTTIVPRCPTDTVAVIARQVPEAMEVLLAQAVRADAAVAREDSEFAVLGRQIAVGGQLLELQGLGGVYTEIFLPLHGEHQAHNAVARAGRGRGVLRCGRGAAARHRRGARGFRVGHQPRPAGADAQCSNGFHRCRAQPGGRRGAGAGAGRGVRLPVPGRRRLGDGRQGRRRHPGRAGTGASTRSW